MGELDLDRVGHLGKAGHANSYARSVSSEAALARVSAAPVQGSPGLTSHTSEARRRYTSGTHPTQNQPARTSRPNVRGRPNKRALRALT